MISWSKFHRSDFESQVTSCSALANGPYLWQGIQFYENTGFFDFCDAIEGATNNTTVLPGASGIGLTKALVNYANWMATQLVPGYCESFGMFMLSYVLFKFAEVLRRLCRIQWHIQR
jgi:hypothetical protein